MKPEVSVVMPTHNPRREYLARTLEALKKQTLDRSRWEVVVVDNASSEMEDGRWEMGF
jgi:glycosyltransferase involved in cell wall biosynthesis